MTINEALDVTRMYCVANQLPPAAQITQISYPVDSAACFHLSISTGIPWR
jgi:hypothetical protein